MANFNLDWKTINSSNFKRYSEQPAPDNRFLKVLIEQNQSLYNMTLNEHSSSTDKHPDVSVIIAAYNAEKTLARAVESAIAQNHCQVEVLISDDASTDRTLIEANMLKNQHEMVSVFSTDQNGGPSKARNTALLRAKGQYITVLDSDDFIEENRLSSLLKIARDGDWDFVGDDLFKVNEDDIYGPRTSLLSVPETQKPERINLADFIEGNLTNSNSQRSELGFLKPLMRRDFLTRNKLTYREDMRLGEDFALYTEALIAGARFCLVPAKGYIAVVRDNSLSALHSAADLEALVRVTERFSKLKGLDRQTKNALKQLRMDTRKRWSWVRLIEAVKTRNYNEMLQTFIGPAPVALHLIYCLTQQAVKRTYQRINN